MGAGFCFFLGGIKYKTQKFSIMVNKAGCSLLFLACIGLSIPTGVRPLASGLHGEHASRIQHRQGCGLQLPATCTARRPCQTKVSSGSHEAPLQSSPLCKRPLAVVGHAAQLSVAGCET